MKVVQFTIPVAKNQSIIVQEDILPHFYEHLHRHNETQIMYIISGEGTMIAGNCMQRFRAGDIYILGSNQPHVFKSSAEYFDRQPGRQVRSLMVFFNPRGTFSSVLNLPEMKLIHRFIEATQQGLQLLGQYQADCSEALMKLKNRTNANRLAAFIELLQKMSNPKKWKVLSTENLEQGISEAEGLRMNDIYQYTMANYTKAITLPEIAAVAHLTPQAFCRYFKKHTLKTFVGFLHEIRISEACKKMMAGNYGSISSIAYETGFSNAVTFNRVFKKVTGVSPHMYMREFQQPATHP